MISFQFFYNIAPVVFVVQHTIVASLAGIDFDPFHADGNRKCDCIKKKN